MIVIFNRNIEILLQNAEHCNQLFNTILFIPSVVIIYRACIKPYSTSADSSIDCMTSSVISSVNNNKDD